MTEETKLLSAELQEIFCSAVDTIVGRRLSDLKFDKTVEAVIVDNSFKDLGIYSVQEGATTYEAQSQGVEYSVNEKVLVQIPNGDYSYNKVIIGKADTELKNQPEKYISPMETFITTDQIQKANDGTIIAKGDGKEETVELLLEKDLNQSGKYNAIAVAGSFQTNLNSPLNNVVDGTYGIRIYLYKTNIEEEQPLVFEFNNKNDFLGDTYNYSSYFQQEQVFAINGNINFTKIKVELYQKGDFKLDNGDKFEVKEGLGAISVKDLTITFGYAASLFQDNTVQIYADRSELQAYPSGNDTVNLNLIWFNKDENNKYLGFTDGSFVNKEDKAQIADGEYQIRWYYEDLIGAPVEIESERNKDKITINLDKTKQQMAFHAEIYYGQNSYLSNTIVYKNSNSVLKAYYTLSLSNDYDMVVVDTADNIISDLPSVTVSAYYGDEEITNYDGMVNCSPDMSKAIKGFDKSTAKKGKIYIKDNVYWGYSYADKTWINLNDKDKEWYTYENKVLTIKKFIGNINFNFELKINDEVKDTETFVLKSTTSVADYDLIIPQTTINNKDGGTIQIQVLKKTANGVETLTATDGEIALKYKIGSSETYNDVNSNWQIAFKAGHIEPITIKLFSNKIYAGEEGPDNYLLWDMETIEFISNLYRLSLSNDYDTVAIDNSGALVSTLPITTTATGYLGSELLTNNYEITCTPMPIEDVVIKQISNIEALKALLGVKKNDMYRLDTQPSGLARYYYCVDPNAQEFSSKWKAGSGNAITEILNSLPIKKNQICKLEYNNKYYRYSDNQWINISSDTSWYTFKDNELAIIKFIGNVNFKFELKVNNEIKDTETFVVKSVVSNIDYDFYGIPSVLNKTNGTALSYDIKVLKKSKDGTETLTAPGDEKIVVYKGTEKLTSWSNISVTDGEKTTGEIVLTLKSEDETIVWDIATIEFVSDGGQGPKGEDGAPGKDGASSLLSLINGTRSQDFYPLYRSNLQVIGTEHLKARHLKPMYWGEINGKALSDENIAGWELEWRLPKNNTMLRWNDNYTKNDEDDENYRVQDEADYKALIQTLKKTGDNKFSAISFAYKIADNYQPSWTNNTITCILRDNNDKLIAQAEKSFTFSKSETMGTGYILQILPVRYVFDTTIYNENLPFTIELKVLDNSGNDVTKQATNLSLGWQETGYAPEAIISGPNNEGKYTITSWTFSRAKGYSVLEAKATINGVTIKEKYSLAYCNTGHGTGTDGHYYAEVPSVLMYDNSGTKIFETDYDLKVYLNTTGSISGVTDDWQIYDITKPGVVTSTSKQIGVPQILGTGLEKPDKLIPYPIFIHDAGYFALQVSDTSKDENDQVIRKYYWWQPLIIEQDRYGSSILNQWDGSYSLDANNGTIMSTAIAAGKKDDNNTYSGVIMGEIGQIDNSTNSSKLGLYGYNKGLQSFGIDIDGTAFLGPSGKGRIWANGEKGYLASTNWLKFNNDGSISGVKDDLTSGTGTLIDLNEGYIKMINKGGGSHFKFTNDGLDIKVDKLSLTSGGSVGGSNLLKNTGPIEDVDSTTLSEWSRLTDTVLGNVSRVENCEAGKAIVIKTKNSSAYAQATIIQSRTLDENKTYTVSGWYQYQENEDIQLENSTRNFAIYTYGRTSNKHTVYTETIENHRLKYFSHTFKPQGADGEEPTIRFGLVRNTNSFVEEETLYLYHLKLEEGSVATAWGESEYDTQARIDITAEGIEQTVSGIKDLALTADYYGKGRDPEIDNGKYKTDCELYYKTILIDPLPNFEDIFSEGKILSVVFPYGNTYVDDTLYLNIGTLVDETSTSTGTTKLGYPIYFGGEKTSKSNPFTWSTGAQINFRYFIDADGKPAWEVVDNSSQQIFVSQFKQTADQIAAKVNNVSSGEGCSWALTEKGFYIAQGNKTITDNTISNYVMKVDSSGLVVKGKIEATSLELSSEAEETINSAVDIEIGGRNLLLNSKDEYTSSTLKNYTISNYGKNIALKGDVKVVVSFEVKGATSGKMDVYFSYGTDNTPSGSGKYIFDVTTSWKKYKQVITLSALSEGKTWSQLRIRSNGSVPGNTSAVSITIRNVKLEIGNKATDWTPAPEDIDSAIAAAAEDPYTYEEVTNDNGVKTTTVKDKKTGETISTTITSSDGSYVYTNVGYGNNGVDPGNDSTTQFVKISSNGLLKANNAIIQGTIYSNAGKIGGWNIGTRSLNYGGGVGESGAIHLCPEGSKSYADIAGSGSINNWVITAGSTFGVTNAGKLYAIDAKITGNITATGGKIGNWNVGSFTDSTGGTYTNSLYSTSPFAANASDSSKKDGYRIFLRSTQENQGNVVIGVRKYTGFTPTSAGDIPSTVSGTYTFYVANNGVLYATTADITGKITATSGKIGPLEVPNSSSLKISTASAYQVSRTYRFQVVFGPGSESTETYTFSDTFNTLPATLTRDCSKMAYNSSDIKVKYFKSTSSTITSNPTFTLTSASVSASKATFNVKFTNIPSISTVANKITATVSIPYSYWTKVTPDFVVSQGQCAMNTLYVENIQSPVISNILTRLSTLEEGETTK